jgi:ATP-dependent RNA helicase RhlE
MSFDSLGLSAELLRAVADQGYDAPTPIQARTIPAVLAGRDLMAAAQTGTGKTAAFTLPLLHRLAHVSPGGGRRVRVLVLAPTRELAAQIGESVRTYGRYLPVRCTEVFGGVNINPQIKALARGPDILVATPGRLLDHLDQRTADLSGIEVLVLDEADRMLDMGFLPAIERVIAKLPRARQTLLLSATFPPPIRALARRLLDRPEVIEVAPPNAAADGVSHLAYLVDKDRKRALLSYLIGSQNWHQVLVFTRTKHGADRLAKQLDQDGLATAAIHGNKTQGARTRVLEAFKRRRVRVLVATDLAARGLDIEQLPHVVNFELPHVPEDYVHRIGRTGRAGCEGAAVSLVCAEERGQLQAIGRLLNAGIPTTVMRGFEPSRALAAPAPLRAGAPGARDHHHHRKRPASGAAAGRRRRRRTAA